ncbi:MAG: hypothetical protein AAF600_19605 [Bacteroidota bacterium]
MDKEFDESVLHAIDFSLYFMKMAILILFSRILITNDLDAVSIHRYIIPTYGEYVTNHR